MKLSYSVAARVSAAVVLAASVLPASESAASDSDLSSAQVATEILRVQAKADATALRWAKAQSRADELASELAEAQERVAATSAELDQLELTLTQIAVSQFTGGSGSPLVLEFAATVDAVQRDALRAFALDAGEGELDTVDAVRNDLEVDQAELEALSTENEQLLEQLAADQIELEAQLTTLAALREHLKKEEVRRAYEAQVAEQRARAEKAAAEAAAAAAAAAAAEKAAATAARVVTPTVSDQPPVVVTARSWFCPVAGATAFGDTWGAPRSGGRRHQGVDMMSAFGTPLVAVVAGFAEMKTNRLGGNTVWLKGVDGNSYYYAHLSSWEGPSRNVSAGEVVGYVGATGNTGTNHLHFQIHPGGGAAVNPTPTVRQFC